MTWSSPPIYSETWTAKLNGILTAVKACNSVFIVSKSMLLLLAAEQHLPRAMSAIGIYGRTFINLDAREGGDEQEFDTVYWQCEYWRCDCDDCQAGKVCFCDSLNVPTLGLHKLIIPPANFDLEQAETYSVLRLDGLSPADAAEAAELL
jgi:hypothetical protein